MSDWYPSESIHPPDDFEESDEGSGEPEPPLREGLPDTYAMRHDRHYVDELLRGPGDGPRETAKRSRPADSPPALTPLLTEVSQGLDAALACWRLSAERPTWSYASTLNRLTQVEIQRVKRLADGLRVLAETPPLVRSPIDLPALVSRVRESTEPERRLVDVTLTSAAGSPVIVAHGDERQLELALASWLQGMTALVAASPDPTLHLGVTAEGAVATLELSTAAAALSDNLLGHFFDDRHLDRPGTYPAAVALAAARRIVERHDGQASVERLTPTGCRVTLTIPL